MLYQQSQANLSYLYLVWIWQIDANQNQFPKLKLLLNTFITRLTACLDGCSSCKQTMGANTNKKTICVENSLWSLLYFVCWRTEHKDAVEFHASVSSLFWKLNYLNLTWCRWQADVEFIAWLSFCQSILQQLEIW